MAASCQLLLLTVLVTVVVDCLSDTDSENGTTLAISPTLTTTFPPGFKRICFQPVGCFDNRPPFDYANPFMPKSPAAVGTTFLLYTRTDPRDNSTVVIDYVNSQSLKNSTFSSRRQTKFIVHGFNNDNTTHWLYTMKDELLKKGDFNVVIVIWGPGAAGLGYNQAVANTRLVATQTKMLLDLMVAQGSSDESMHFIGHSLGAHTSGYVGYLLGLENRTLGRISGMDPAQPDYEKHPKPVRLDKSDANFVDVIHSNGAKVLLGIQLGLMQQSGHVDFFLNGGKRQPGCPDVLHSIANGKDFSDIADNIACSHGRAHDVYTESINSNQCPFTAYPCESYEKFQRGECLRCGPKGCSQLGYYSDFYFAEGKMYLNTRSSEPFCGFHYGVKLRGSPSGHSTKGRVLVKLHGLWGNSTWLQVTGGDNVSMGKGGQIGRVVISDVEVGNIRDIGVKYIPGPGGQKTWRAEEIQVESGETGKRFLFCLKRALVNGTSMTVARATNETC